jgi:hypothetical protein
MEIAKQIWPDDIMEKPPVHLTAAVATTFCSTSGSGNSNSIDSINVKPPSQQQQQPSDTNTVSAMP